MSGSRSSDENRARVVNVGAGAQLRIVSIGPLSWMQGYEHVLSAVKLLMERGVACMYRIVGRGEYFDAIAFARHQLGLEGCVELLQPDSGAEPRAHLWWADVLVDASVAAVSPKAVREAQASGVPVVTTEPAHSGSALVVPRRDPDALCDALEALARDRGLRARLVAAGRRSALQMPRDFDQAAWKSN